MQTDFEIQICLCHIHKYLKVVRKDISLKELNMLELTLKICIFSNKSQFLFAIHYYPLHCACAQHQTYSDCGHHSLWLIWLAYGSVAFAGTEIIKSGRKS